MSTDSSKKLPWSPWLAVVFVVALFFTAQILASILTSIYPALHHWSGTQADHWLNNSISAQFFYVLLAESLVLGGIYLFLRSRRLGVSAIGLKKPRWEDPLYALAMVPVYYIAYIIIVAAVGHLVPSLNVNEQQQLGFNNAHGASALILTFISLVVLPPITEEVLIRGFLYGSLRENMPKIWAALIASLIFASAHLPEGGKAGLLWIGFLDTFVLSMVLVYLREKTGSLWASITLHGIKNSVAFVALFVLHMS